MNHIDMIVAGGGQAGLAASYWLKQGTAARRARLFSRHVMDRSPEERFL
jgi:hypothetical protein